MLKNNHIVSSITCAKRSNASGSDGIYIIAVLVRSDVAKCNHSEHIRMVIDRSSRALRLRVKSREAEIAVAHTAPTPIDMQHTVGIDTVADESVPFVVISLGREKDRMPQEQIP